MRRSENRLKDIIDFLPDTTFAVNLEEESLHGQGCGRLYRGEG